MKYHLVTASILTLGLGLSAQESQPVIKVQVKGIMPLVHHKGNSFFKYKKNSWSAIGRLESAIRIQDHSPRFIVSVNDHDADSVYLVKLMPDIDDYSRITYLNGSDAKGPHKENMIEIERKKTLEGSWEFSPKTSLKRGEYALFRYSPSTKAPTTSPYGSGGPDLATLQAWYDSEGGDFWDFGIDNQ